MCAAGRDAPLCRCGERSLTDLRTAELRRRWSDAEGVKWSWVSSGRALWYLCEPCHHQAWPEDGRCNNRHSRPVAQRRDLGYATRLMAGNLSLGLSVLPSVRRSVLCGLVWSLSVSVCLFCGFKVVAAAPALNSTSMLNILWVSHTRRCTRHEKCWVLHTRRCTRHEKCWVLHTRR